MIPRFVAQSLNCILFASVAGYSLLIVAAAGYTNTRYIRDITGAAIGFWEMNQSLSK